MILHLIDVSSHIHVGNITQTKFFEGPIQNTPDGYKMPIIRTGGISFLFNKVYEFGRGDKMVFVCDRTPTNRLNIDAEYKSGRPPKPDVDTQKILAEIILEDCGYEVVYEDGYEADDLIYSLADKYKNDTDIDHIYIHSDDSDLYISVDDKVSILPTSSRGKTVNKNNYKYTVRANDLTEYNSLSFIKMLSGDTSDKIKALPASLRNQMSEFFFGNTMLSKRLHYPEIVGNIVETKFPLAYHNFQLVYPHISEVEIDLFRIPDRNKTAYWGKVVGNANFRSAKTIGSIDERIEEFFAQGYAND